MFVTKNFVISVVLASVLFSHTLVHRVRSQTTVSGGPCIYWFKNFTETKGLCGVYALCPQLLLGDENIEHHECPFDALGIRMICCPKSLIRKELITTKPVSSPILEYTPLREVCGISYDKFLWKIGISNEPETGSIYTLNETARKLKEDGFAVTVTGMFADAISNMTYARGVTVQNKWFAHYSGVSPVGGKPAPREMSWFMALIGSSIGNEIRWLCDGVVLNNRWILSAAHCFLTAVQPNVVRLGDYNWSDDNETERMWGGNDELLTKVHQSPIYDIVLYPDFLPENRYHDIVLIEIEKPYPLFSRFINPICLPWDDFTDIDFTGYDVTLSGWGATEYNAFGILNKTPILQAVELEVFNMDRCIQSYSRLPDYLRKWPEGLKSDTFICAGWKEGGRDACKGDSGGPLFFFRSEKFVLAGIVSTGHGCGTQEFPGIYTKINHPSYLKWIKETAFKDFQDSGDSRYLERFGDRCVLVNFKEVGRCEGPDVNYVGSAFPWLPTMRPVNVPF